MSNLEDAVCLSNPGRDEARDREEEDDLSMVGQASWPRAREQRQREGILSSDEPAIRESRGGCDRRSRLRGQELGGRRGRWSRSDDQVLPLSRRCQISFNQLSISSDHFPVPSDHFHDQRTRRITGKHILDARRDTSICPHGSIERGRVVVIYLGPREGGIVLREVMCSVRLYCRV